MSDQTTHDNTPDDGTSARPMTVPAPTRVRWGSIALFTVIAYALAWLVVVPLWGMDLTTMSGQIWLNILIPVMMFTPGIAALVMTFFVKNPRTDRARSLGFWPLRPAKRVVWMSVIALFGTMAIAFAALGVAAACGWLTLDLVGFSGYVELNEAALPEGMDASVLPPAPLLVGLQLAIVPIAAILPNGIFALGEELGWRGWLLPALRPLGTWPALLVSGAIWGVWHAPVTLLGHNYGLFDWRGVALMTVNCVVWGMLLGWLRLRTGSVWPAVIAHGALNAVGGVALLVAAAGHPVNPALGTVAGVAGWIVVAIIVAVLAATGQFTKQPMLDARKRRET